MEKRCFLNRRNTVPFAGCPLLSEQWPSAWVIQTKATEDGTVARGPLAALYLQLHDEGSVSLTYQEPCLCLCPLILNCASPALLWAIISLQPNDVSASFRVAAIPVLVLCSHLPLPGSPAAPRHHRALQAVGKHLPLRALWRALHLPGPA